MVELSVDGMEGGGCENSKGMGRGGESCRYDHLYSETQKTTQSHVQIAYVALLMHALCFFPQLTVQVKVSCVEESATADTVGAPRTTTQNT